jgi:uncharacterized protein
MITRQIQAYRCRGCGELHYPFRMRCRGCGELEPFQFDPEPLPTRGTLLTYTYINNLPFDFEVPGLGVGVVELENGIRMTGQVQIDAPRTGMAVVGEVEVVRRRGYDEHYGMVFRAVA